MLFLLFACTGNEPDDSAEPADTDEEGGGTDCDVLEIRHSGEDPPFVGDTWTVFLWCDDTLLLGAMRILVEPTDFATISENEVTFASVGTGELTMQLGSRRQTLAITVAPPS